MKKTIKISNYFQVVETPQKHNGYFCSVGEALTIVILGSHKFLELLDVGGHMIVADALNCQKETSKAIRRGKVDYLLRVKDNQQTLKEELESYVKDDHLRIAMDTYTTLRNKAAE